MCPIKGMENKYAYLAERDISHPTALSLLLEHSVSLFLFFLPPLHFRSFYGGNCSFSSHHWLKENFNTLLALQELDMI